MHLLCSSGSNQQSCNKAIISTNLAHSTCGRAYDVPIQSRLEHHRGFRLFSYRSIVLNPATNQIWRACDCLLRDFFFYLPQKTLQMQILQHTFICTHLFMFCHPSLRTNHSCRRLETFSWWGEVQDQTPGEIAGINSRLYPLPAAYLSK